MVRLLFSTRFRSQIRRARQAEMDALDWEVKEAIRGSGGRMSVERRMIWADFDESGLAFALDLVILVERLLAALAEAKDALFGHTCVLCNGGSDIDDEGSALLRTVPYSDGSGVWVDDYVHGLLEPFIVFKERRSMKNSSLLWSEIEKMKDFARFSGKNTICDPGREEIFKFLCAVGEKNSGKALVGQNFIGKRRILHEWAGSESDFPPIIVRFGLCGGGLACFSDAWAGSLRERITKTLPDYPAELDKLEQELSPARLSHQNSPCTEAKAVRFWQILLETAAKAAQREKKKCVVILENIQDAQESHIDVVKNAVSLYQTLPLYAVCGGKSLPSEWQPLFSEVLPCQAQVVPGLSDFSLSPSLIEAAYICTLLFSLVPAHVFFEYLALGKTAKVKAPMMSRAIEILTRAGLFRSQDDLSPDVNFFVEDAEAALGEERKNAARAIVTEFLLYNVKQKRLRPCYRLLEILYKLGGKIGDRLALDALRADVTGGITLGVTKSIVLGEFFRITGEDADRGASLLMIFKTLKALTEDNADEIHRVFQEEAAKVISVNSVTENESKERHTLWPAYRPFSHVIEATYRLGLLEHSAALSEAKEALLESQQYTQSDCLTQIYRILALTHFSLRQSNEALEYLGFAIENAEREGSSTELTLSSYYASATQFTYGNTAKALRLVKRASESAQKAGLGEWVGRADFTWGRYLFEIGRYAEAGVEFSRLLEESGPGINEKNAVLNAWIFRSKIYQGCQDTAAPFESACADFRLFQIEAFYLAADWRKTIEAADALLENLPDKAFLFLERPDWSSGFAQCELLQVTPADFYGRMASVWRAAALAEEDSANCAASEAAIREVLYDDRFSDTTPNDVLQYYLYYHILRGVSSDSIDRNSAISVAFKRLQRRASRIDDIEIKRSFLSQRWNAAIFQAAREHKLI